MTSLHGRFFMLRYLAILRLREQGLSLRSIAASTGNSRQKVTEVIDRATDKGLMGPFDDDMTDKWIEEFLFPEKTLESSGRHPIDFDYVHKELAKPNVTLSLLHHEYEMECRTNKCILQYKCGSYAMLVNDDEQSPEGGRSFFWNISEHNSDRDFDKAPEF